MDAVFMLLLVSAVLGIGLALNHHHRKQLRATWTDAAEALRGTVKVELGGIFGHFHTMLEARIDGIEVVAQQHGTGKHSRTEITARADGAAHLVIGLRRERALSSAMKALGAQDVEVGQPKFDQTFIVRTNDPDWARAWLAPNVRASLLKATDYQYSVEDSEARAELGYGVDDQQALERAVRAVAALAGGGRALMQEWTELCRSLGGVLSAEPTAWTPSPSPTISLEQDLVPVELDMLRHRGGHSFGDQRTFTRVRARVAKGRLEPFAAVDRECADRVEVPALPAADSPFGSQYIFTAASADKTLPRLSNDLRARIRKLGPAAVLVDSTEAVLLLPGVVMARDQLHEAVELAVAMAIPAGSSPYR